MNVLVAVSLAGSLKSYIEPKYLEMASACIDPLENVDTIVYGNKGLGNYEFRYCDIGGNGWADDVIYATHQAALDDAKRLGYDKVVFQGVDCLYNSRQDFESLISHDKDIVGAITMGRKAPEYTVVRDWKIKNGKVTREQFDIICDPKKENLQRCGFPGTEACVINKNCFDIPIANPKYRMWYSTEDKDIYLCVHEFFMYEAAKLGKEVYCDTSIRTWHADDSGNAHRWLSRPVRNENLFWRGDTLEI